MENNCLLSKLLEIEQTILNGEIPEVDETEDYVSGKFDLIIYKFNSEKAFLLLELLTQKSDALYLKYKDAFTSVFFKLINKSDTTEKPRNLNNVLKYLPEEKVEYIKNWYNL
jgi:hypothetical protein